MMKQLVAVGIAVMGTLLALILLWQFRSVLVYVVISLTVAATLRPWVNRLVGQSFLKRMGWIMLYLAALGSFGYLLFLVGETAITEIQLFATTVAMRDAWILPTWLAGSPSQMRLIAQLPPPSMLFEALTGDQGQFVLPVMLGFTQGIGDVVSGAFIILFLSIYWSLNQVHFERLWLSLLASDRRKQARGIWRTIELDLGRYIRSELFQSLLAGLLLGVGYWLLGSPYPALLALIGALAWLIPVVGALAAIILPLILGLLTSVQLSLITAIYTLGVLFALQLWVEPRIFKRRWNNPILTLIIILAMADAFGLIGILVAPPISAICQILWKLLVSNRAVAGAAAQVSDLKERQARAWKMIKAMNEPPMALVTSGMARLTQLIEKSEPILQSGLAAEASGPFNPHPSLNEQSQTPDPTKP